MRITACVGDYAEKPYSVPGVDLLENDITVCRNKVKLG